MWLRLYMQGAYADIHRDGVFAKDSELKEFLTSGPAICAALQLQHCFECQHNQQDLRVLQLMSQSVRPTKAQASLLLF